MDYLQLQFNPGPLGLPGGFDLAACRASPANEWLKLTGAAVPIFQASTAFG
jgi:hypothetical protein